jgi:hypothetical protein
MKKKIENLVTIEYLNKEKKKLLFNEFRKLKGSNCCKSFLKLAK